MKKFINLDLLNELRSIMETNTKHYQSDFDIDSESLMRAASEAKDTPLKDRIFLWMSRPSGTWCLREKTLFLKDSSEYKTWTFYGDSDDRILAYGIEVAGMENGKAMGSIYELDYRKHVRHVIESALPASQTKLIYAKGTKMQPAEKPFPTQEDPVLGKLESFELIPDNPDQLAALLCQEQESREKLRAGDIQKHIAMLQNRK